MILWKIKKFQRMFDNKNVSLEARFLTPKGACILLLIGPNGMNNHVVDLLRFWWHCWYMLCTYANRFTFLSFMADSLLKKRFICAMFKGSYRFKKGKKKNLVTRKLIWFQFFPRSLLKLSPWTLPKDRNIYDSIWSRWLSILENWNVKNQILGSRFLFIIRLSSVKTSDRQ